MGNMYLVPTEMKDEFWDLMVRLFPVNRSILGSEYQESLEEIAKILPIQILNYPSGSQCGSWIVPQEWVVREAFIADARGNRIVNFEENKLYICQYSRPFIGRVSREELLKHLLVHPSLPEAIPARATFYRDDWFFCVSQREQANLNEEYYDVTVDSTLHDGVLRIGEVYLPGESEQEVLFDAVLSCSSLANNFSGVIVAVFLTKLLLSKETRRWSYRLLLTPETIGPIAIHYLSPGRLAKVIGGYTFVNLADRSDTFHYKKSRAGNTVADVAMAHALRHFGKKYSVEEYDVKTGTCGNEKAYNSLGIELPIGAIRRSIPGSYPEYDTSQDDLTFVDKDSLFESFQLLWGVVETLERSRVFRHTFVGEPFLTRYGLLPKIANERERIPWDYLMGFTTGDLSTVEIAEKAGLPVIEFDEAVRLMLLHGLIREE